MKKKYLALLLTGILTLSMAGCGKEKESPAPPEENISQEEVDFDKAEQEGSLVTAEQGEILVSATPTSNVPTEPTPGTNTPFRSTTITPEQVWDDNEVVYGSGSFTMPDATQMANGSVGELVIPKIGVDVNVFESDNPLESMTHGVGHLKETSCWDGNVGITGHNQGVNTYFGKLYQLQPGDTATLTTALGTRTYQVVSSAVIDQMDWSRLDRTEDNRLTLITCVNYNLQKRLCVQLIEVQ